MACQRRKNKKRHRHRSRKKALRFSLDVGNKAILAAVGMGHNQDAAVSRHSNGDEPLFRERVIRVTMRHRQRIGEYAPLRLEFPVRRRKAGALGSGLDDCPVKR
jgi:hypothetical protein